MRFLFCLITFLSSGLLFGQSNQAVYLLKPDRVFDGEKIHTDWVVVTKGPQIMAAGKLTSMTLPPEVQTINLPGMTLMPGMIEGHSHVLLHPYNETSWNDQVLVESSAERVARGTVHLRKSLEAGFTTLRDLGSEGSGYDDVGLKIAVQKEVIPGPRLVVAGRAIVATGSYGPKGFAPHVQVPLGAEPADGHDNLIKVVRDQIGQGADVIKVYADYRWGPEGAAMPTFTQKELDLIVEIAASSGRKVVAHAATEEGMRRAALAGVQTIEHGDGGTPEIWQIMAQNKIALCPTLAAADAILQYRGWDKTNDPEPIRITQKKASFKAALRAGVPIVAGGDVGVFPHGDNVRELELMVEYGMSALEVWQTVTKNNAVLLGLNDRGRIKTELLADLIAIQGQPETNISDLRKVKFVMKDGKIFLHQSKK
jgi:imidazolonepropionase-like amidohydrolase